MLVEQMMDDRISADTIASWRWQWPWKLVGLWKLEEVGSLESSMEVWKIHVLFFTFGGSN